MNRCDEIAELIPLYIDGELCEEERAALEEHLTGCADCRELEKELRATLAGLSELPDEELPAGFREGWKSRLQPAVIPRALKPSAFVYAAASVLIMFILLSGIGAAISLGRPDRGKSSGALQMASAGIGAYSGEIGAGGSGAADNSSDVSEDASFAENITAGASGAEDSTGQLPARADRSFTDGGADSAAQSPSLADSASSAPPAPAESAADSGGAADNSINAGETAISAANEPAAGSIAPSPAEDPTDSADSAATCSSVASQGIAPISAPSATDSSTADSFLYTFSITIDTGDFDGTLNQIQALGGWVVNSQINNLDANGEKTASITRRISMADYEAAKDALWQSGQVVSEDESLVKYTSQIQDVQVRIAAKSQETDRLTALLAKSGAIDVMTAVESYLSTAASELDSLRGQLRYYQDITQSPYLNITVVSGPAPAPPDTPQTLGARMNDSFAGSWNTAVDFLAAAAVWIVGAIIPLAIIALVIIAGLLIAAGLIRKQGRRGHDK